MFGRKLPTVENADLIDRLLATDPSERRLVIFEALKSGELKAHDADSVVRMVERLERVTAPGVTAAPVADPAPADAPETQAA